MRFEDMKQESVLSEEDQQLIRRLGRIAAEVEEDWLWREYVKAQKKGSWG